MQFKVPQFIDIEDKVIGPLTFRQFAYLAGGAGFAYLSIRLLPGFIALVVTPACIAFALALAFMKYNDKPFIHVLQAFISFYTKSRLYLWHRSENTEKKKELTASLPINRGTLTESKLKTLSWSLDVIDTKK